RFVGQDDPAFTLTYNGQATAAPAEVAGSPLFAVSITLTQDGVPVHYTSSPTSPVGNYVVHVSGLTSPDYTITYVSGTLRVSKSPAT
ncbi:MBG domain-containing protein, partial [Jatrophihabitans sp.]|uniref:MBG domain-containing protein n=1 Tax=Jatrophihabitans sp. TaxID=1932789 RepID=UPI0030C6EC44|nr:domain type [Jatrophihabitans sp.]